jgi:hypothetical protein
MMARCITTNPRYFQLQLAVFYLAIMLSQFPGWQSLRFSLATFIPANPPALDTFSFVSPDSSHDIHSIVILVARNQARKTAEMRLSW